MNWTEIVLGGLTLLGGCAWLTFGLPPSRLGSTRACSALHSAWRRFNLNIVVPLTIVDLCRDSAELMRASLCARCSIGCNRGFRSWSRRLSVYRMRLKGLTVVDLRRDSAMPESELSSLLSLLRRLTAALIGLSVLCWTAWRSRLARALGRAIASVVLLSLIASCASSRRATSSHSEQVSSLTNVESATPWHSSSELGSAHGSNADFRFQDSRDSLREEPTNEARAETKRRSSESSIKLA